MTEQEKNYVEELEKLEPVFVEAGKHALSRQKNIKHSSKHNSGYFEVDVVTEADKETQELILNEMKKTILVSCHLIAEEDTPSVDCFKSSGDLYLTLDPIDGTAVYVRGQKYFSVLIMLHNKTEILYIYNYFPALDWGYRITSAKFESFGKRPDIKTRISANKVIAHTYGDPKVIDQALYTKLAESGYKFKLKGEISVEGVGAGTLFINGKVDGYFIPNPGAYDGIFIYQYAKVMGYEIYASGPQGEFRIDEFKEDHGLVHPGYYIVLRK